MFLTESEVTDEIEKMLSQRPSPNDAVGLIVWGSVLWTLRFVAGQVSREIAISNFNHLMEKLEELVKPQVAGVKK
ncbi:MAG: hypothetical protein KGI50_06645 [Patescibacteria group bacterium]|nr:hypothetical protein [Patescibacteria group bacterium]MDE2439109.1 hypothetical protein [Patescibacteria group bacterium]